MREVIKYLKGVRADMLNPRELWQFEWRHLDAVLKMHDWVWDKVKDYFTPEEMGIEFLYEIGRYHVYNGGRDCIHSVGDIQVKEYTWSKYPISVVPIEERKNFYWYPLGEPFLYRAIEILDKLITKLESLDEIEGPEFLKIEKPEITFEEGITYM